MSRRRDTRRTPAASADSSEAVVCRYYMLSECHHHPCRFVHDANLCFDFWRTGECTSTTCEKKHPVKFKGQGVETLKTNGRPAQEQRHRDPVVVGIAVADTEAAHSATRGPKTDAAGEPRNHAATVPRSDGAQASSGSYSKPRLPPQKKQKPRRAPVDDEYAAVGNEEGPKIGGDARLPASSGRMGLSKLPMPRTNTETFTPSHDPCTMRVVIDTNTEKMSVRLTVRDVLCVPCMFKRPGDEAIYDRIVHEIEHCGISEEHLLKSWHGDSHWIADDTTGWKKQCPTFLSVIQRLRDYFGMDIKATRFNWYKDTGEWKPFHHDAAAVKPDKARTQNFTVGVSFGATRVAAFEDAKTRTTVAFPQPDGTVYCFARDTNILWRHGILQEKEVKPAGRISIIAWGWVDQEDV